MDTVPCPLPGEVSFKRDMKKVKKLSDLQLSVIIEHFAKDNGYQNYNAMRNEWKAGRIQYDRLLGKMVKI